MPEQREVITYIRQYDDVGTEFQLEQLKKYAEQNSLSILKVVKDDSTGQDNLNTLIQDIRTQKYKHLLVYSLFSLTVSPVHLDSIFALLSKNSSHLTIAKDQLSTLNGKELVFSVGRMMLRYALGSQRLMIKRGQKQAKKKGKQLGRPGVSDKVLLEAKDLRDRGLSYRQIGRLLKLDESTIRKNLRKI